MAAFISIFIVFGGFFLFIFAVISKLKKHNQEAIRRHNERVATTVTDPSHSNPYVETTFTEGAATVKKVKPKKHNVQPVSNIVVEEPEDDEDLLPDFTDEDEIRKAVISTEILNRKYQ